MQTKGFLCRAILGATSWEQAFYMSHVGVPQPEIALRLLRNKDNSVKGLSHCLPKE